HDANRGMGAYTGCKTAMAASNDGSCCDDCGCEFTPYRRIAAALSAVALIGNYRRMGLGET
ncbi:hypothetical protein, partial [Acinetobacter baumannii]|uniref:hypothetical protein n=1 Tax=Acinetobacter baumannii TaxID=470 RepID=UPI000AD1AEB6